MNKGKEYETYLGTLVDPSSEYQKVICATVAEEFGKIEQVLAIHYEKDRSTMKFDVYINSPKYDESLMDRLFEIELDKVESKYPEIVFDFFYPPVVPNPDKIPSLENPPGFIYIRRN